jgi:parallel beta-helix repeat protein
VPTHVVDPYPGRGDFATVSAAISGAQPGERIMVRPGLYEECLVLDKPVEIIGDGPVSEIVIRARGAEVLLFQTSTGRLVNLTLCQAGGPGAWFGINVTQGRLVLEDCDISSQSLSCVAIRDGADPLLRRNKIHDGMQNGVLIHDNGMGTLEDNDIADNALAGVAIKTGANPILRRNQIHDNRQSGVFVHEGGLGTLVDNDITSNAAAGVAIQTGGNPRLDSNYIHHGLASGVFVQDSGLGTLEDNDIIGNALSGVQIKTSGNPTLRCNRINHNGHEAIRVIDLGRGLIEDNDLTGNRQGPWLIEPRCETKVTRARNKEW